MYSQEKFEKLVKEFLQKEEAIMGWKAGEYSNAEDRLQNFREIANFMGDKPIVITPAILAFREEGKEK